MTILNAALKALLTNTGPSDTTTGQMKSALGSVYDFITDLLGGDSSNKQGARAALGLDAIIGNSGPVSGLRNRAINGDCRIDQQFNGSVATVNGYALDGWSDSRTVTGVYAAQRIASDLPGFPFCWRHTVNTAATPAASDVYQVIVPIEGQNVPDFALGTSSAKTFTVSAWVRSSIPGTYGFFVSNGAGNRFLAQTYAINAANTWEYKTFTVAGDVAGTWATDNSAGLAVGFDLGSGSNCNTASTNTWGSTPARRTSSCVNLTSTFGAAFDVTGLQVELGTVATPFERRSVSTELALCQRYLVAIRPGWSFSRFGMGGAQSSAVANMLIPISATMRATPSLSVQGNVAVAIGGTNYPVTGFSIINSAPGHIAIDVTCAAGGMTAGQSSVLIANNDTNAAIILNAGM